MRFAIKSVLAILLMMSAPGVVRPQEEAAGPALAAEPAPAPANYPFAVRVVGTGTPMILVAGLGMPGDVFKPIVKDLSRDYECHLVTLGGFAGEEPVAAPVLPKYREGLVRYISDNKLDHPVIVGQSIGGLLAYWVAASAPDSVRAVIVIDGSPWITGLIFPDQTPESYAKRAREIRQETLSQTPEVRQKKARFGMGTMVKDRQALERVIEWNLESDPETLAQANLEMFTTDIRQELAAIKVPVLLVAAPGDTEDPAALEAVRKNYGSQLTAIRNLRIEVPPNSRHFVQYEKPDFLRKVMWEFLETPTVPGPAAADEGPAH